MYAGGIRTSQEASKVIMKHQEGLENVRPGRETSLCKESRLCRETRLGAGDQPRLGGQALQKEQVGYCSDSKLNRDLKPWLRERALQGDLAGQGDQPREGGQALLGGLTGWVSHT